MLRKTSKNMVRYCLIIDVTGGDEDGKVKLSLCLTKCHIMKMYGRVEVQIRVFLSSVLDGGEWSTSHHTCFTSRERTLGTHWIGGWVCLIAGLMKRKVPAPARK
jgi:hypothetical protein